MDTLVSTRDTERHVVSYDGAVLEGLARGGGLYVPESYVHLSEAQIKGMHGSGYLATAKAVKGLFAGESFTAADISGMVDAAYTKEKFPHMVNDILAPVRQVDDDIYLLDLSQGPTAAFKDVALQLLAQEMALCIKNCGTTLRVVGATSGDTGSAAEAAVKGVPGIDLFMLSPTPDRMSVFQRAQMGVLSGGNITNITVEGTFDHCQDLVKELKERPGFTDIGAVNSINWSRITSQVAYYFAGYLQTAENYGDPIDVVVPSGNFGNLLAGFIAREMGLPIRKLIAATNENDILNELVQTGVYRSRGDKAKPTTSPSMDITVASNFERVLYNLLGGDAGEVGTYMKQFKETGVASFEDFGLPNDILLSKNFDSGVSTGDDRLESIRWVDSQIGYVIDTHTADAITVARRHKGGGVRMLCLETAHAVKFEPTIREALGRVPKRELRFEGIEGRVPEGAFVHIRSRVEELEPIVARAA